MKRINFKIAVMALAFGVFAVSCGGNANKQQATGGNASEAKTETKASATTGGMEAFGESDKAEISSEMLDDLFTRTGLKALGKPKGSSIKEAWYSDDIFGIRFICDNFSSAYYDGYTKAMWDLSKSIAVNGVLGLRDYDSPVSLKPVNSINDTKSEYNDNSNSWYYLFGGIRWKIDLFGEGNEMTLVIEKE